ncbi:MAG: serine/threonine protein kinase [Deltaproteobacteria bacterium]|nr:serine/threonine protein kinase [Deltaproteobacteria bacterium]
MTNENIKPIDLRETVLSVAVGRTIGGKYELEEIAGTGGMANVWRATLKGPGRFRRTVAIKHMHPDLKETDNYLDMFFEEARVGAELQDGNIVQTYDFFEDEGEHFIVMEWIEGMNLFTYIKYINHIKSRTKWELAVAIGIGVLRGLVAAHEYVDEKGQAAPVLHRDISPHNILINEKGSAKLIDFGLALAGDRLSAPTPAHVAKGKLSYLAPEVLQGNKATHLSDQYSVGNLLWETLAGRKVFRGADDNEIYKKVIAGKIEPLSRVRPDVPKPLLKIISKSMHVDPQSRYASIREMILELTNLLRTAKTQDDFYALLAASVQAGRQEFNLGRRTQLPFKTGEPPAEESEIAIELKDRTISRKFFKKITSFMRQ